MPTFLTVALSASVTSAFTLARADHAFTIEVPSGTGAQTNVQFTSTSGGGTWHTYRRLDGSAEPWAANSGNGPGFAVLLYAPTPFCRVLLSSPATQVLSFTVYELTR